MGNMEGIWTFLDGGKIEGKKRAYEPVKIFRLDRLE